MKILMLNYEFPPIGGGASPVTQEIAKGLVRLGNSVDVVTMGFKGLPQFEIVDGINVYRVKCLRKKKEISKTYELFTYIFSAIKFIKKLIKEKSYDICYCHFIIPTGIIALWLKQSIGLNYVLTAHGSDIPGYNPDRFKIEHRFTGPIIKQICRKASMITTPSKYLSDLLKSKISNFNISVVPNGAKDFYDKNIKKQNLIMSCGRLLPRKGFQYLIESFNELNPDGWQLIIVGDGPYKPKLLKAALGNQNILFTGWLDNTSITYKELLNKSKIFVLLSSRESQGIVYVEAMSTGCAILSSNITGSDETVSDKVGIKTSHDNVQEITEKLRYLIENEEARNNYMKNSLTRYRSMYKYENIVKLYQDILMDAVNDKVQYKR